jgi:[acyl-carrier-protein] S-malonyltransferase
MMKPVALIFPGQGAQKVGMGKEFYETSTAARKVFDQADRIIPGLTEVAFNGPQEKLTSTGYCQPAILTMSMAAFEAFKVHPKFQACTIRCAAGLSLGEYTALTAAGNLSLEEALRLVERRAAFMEEETRKTKGAMAAILGFDQERIVAVCRETGAEVANFNSPEQIVITGYADKVSAAGHRLKEEGAKVIPLDVSGAFHSTLMTPAAEKFKTAVESVTILPSKITVIHNVHGRPACSQEEIKNLLTTQITSSVQWVDSMTYLIKQGITHFLEIGPGRVLKGLMKKISPDVTVINIQAPADIDQILFS